ncbi:aspartate/glutamate racemase family protein [Morganella morganii]|uniref:aspartate/glutamate racemase family protein n=1 Tax=Morganella morganii TaxID=582 RepID=UPI001BDACFDD|nr:aspartate/glutamate racemase family protein [Morganella morganii]MBT0309303.1 aspartate/glutamate racemase family protein [Morganella morganii subsp. morganii]
MKMIGLIGGMSWESSQHYYRIINEQTMERQGRPHSAKSLMWSMDFGEIEALQHAGKWDELAAKMTEAAGKLELAGADFIVICTNTMHRMAEQIEQTISVPLLHIADATAINIQQAGIKKIGLLGTAFTMEQDFYKGRLTEKFGLDVIIPDTADRKIVHDIIYQELVSGIINEASREQYKTIIRKMINEGAEGIILGCTEIMLLISQSDCAVPVFDTTEIHALAAVDYALA